MSNVIYLAFKSPHVEDDQMAFLSCKQCKNKTYTLTCDSLDNFPLMRCAACGQHIGRMGWHHDNAQGIEAQRAETTGSVHESPVPEGNAPTPSHSDNQQEDK